MRTYKIKCDNCENKEMIITEKFIDNKQPEKQSVDLKDWVDWEEPEPVKIGFTVVRTASCLKCGRFIKQGEKYKKIGEE